MFDTKFMQAFSYYSGSSFSPNMNSHEWRGLAERLDTHTISPYIFAYYIFTGSGKNKLTPLHLQRKSWLCTEDMWNAFLVYYADLDIAAARIVKLQRARFKAYKKIYPSPMALLRKATFELNSIIRLDYALLYRDTHNENVDDLLLKYKFDALLLANGIPAYVPLCKMFQCWCIQNQLLEET